MKNLWQIFEKHSPLLFLLFWLGAAVLLFVTSPSTSPANPYYSADSGVFYLMGRGILHGLVPYTDLFDHKGPLLYCIYALGQWLIPGKAGVFLLQTICIGVSWTLLYKFFRLYVEPLTAWVLLLVSLLCMTGCIFGGSTEEWSLPLSLWALYLVSRHLTLRGKVETLPRKIWFLLGFIGAMHFLLRLNNAAPVCGLAAALFLLLFAKRKFIILLRGFLFLMLGFLLPLVLCLVYLYAIGAANDFFQSYIAYNFSYGMRGANVSTFVDHLRLSTKLLSLPLMCVAGIVLYRRKLLAGSEFILFLIMSVATALPLFLARRFTHYDMTYIPVIACALVVLSIAIRHCKKGWIRYAFLCLCLASFGIFLKEGGAAIKRNSASFLKKNTTEYLSFRDVVDAIPKEERNSFLGYDVWPVVYLHTDIMPCHRYFFLQTWLARFDPSIEKTLEDYFGGENPPNWVIIPRMGDTDKKGILALKNPVIRDVLLRRYEYVGHACQHQNWEDDNFSLFRRIK